MPDQTNTYIWRCARCSYHFANLSKVDGLVKEEKKCPRCKSLNILTITSKEMILQCKFFDPQTNGYGEEYGFE